MLSSADITKFAGVKVLDKHTLTEYYQYEILDSFYKQSGSENYSFMGGTAIRIVHGGKRFSEDIDLDTTNIELFDDLLSEVVRDMTVKGFFVEFRLIHKGAYHCYIKFPAIMYELGLSTHQEEKLLIKVDVTSTSKLHASDQLLNNYDIFRNIKANSADTILAQKLYTIRKRKRTKGRDLYDVTWLWGYGDPNEEYLHELSGISLKENLTLLLSFLKELDLQKLSDEVVNFLIDPDDVRRIELFPQFIAQKLAQL